MLTIKPDTRAGLFAVLNEHGDPVGMGVARASRTIPGYVTIVIQHGAGRGTALRVPSNWETELERIPEGDIDGQV